VALRAEKLERHSDPEQALLCAVVEVAFEPPPLLVSGPDDPRARLAQLRQLGAQLRLESLVLERETRGRAGRLEQRRLVEEDESLTIEEAAMAASCLSALGGPSHEPLDPPEPNRYALIGAQSTPTLNHDSQTAPCSFFSRAPGQRPAAIRRRGGARQRLSPGLSWGG